jgi:hypothetical protein
MSRKSRDLSKSILWALSVAISLGASGWIVAQTDGTGVKRPLDLPSGGKGDDEDEEDAPETITFYGGEYEGDGFFWCVDHSCSMSTNNLIGQLKAEMTESISQLSDESEFSIVAFSSGYTYWSPIPREANAGNRSSAIAFVQSLSPDGMTCLAPAGVYTISISNMSNQEHKQILVLSDGEPNCPGAAETLSAMTAANWQHTPINTIYIASDAGGIAFMQQLAAMNGGTFSTPNN